MLFDNISVPYSQIKSAPDFVRIKLSDFDEFIKNQLASDILQKYIWMPLALILLDAVPVI